MSTTTIVILVLIAVLVLWLISIYNNLVALKNRFKTRSRRSMCS